MWNEDEQREGFCGPHPALAVVSPARRSPPNAPHRHVRRALSLHAGDRGFKLGLISLLAIATPYIARRTVIPASSKFQLDFGTVATLHLTPVLFLD